MKDIHEQTAAAMSRRYGWGVQETGNVEEALRATAQRERERCACIVDDTEVVQHGGPGAYEHPDDGAATLGNAARAIRALGEEPAR